MPKHVTAAQQLFGSANPKRAADLLQNPLSAAAGRNPNENELKRRNKLKRKVLDKTFSAGHILGGSSI